MKKHKPYRAWPTRLAHRLYELDKQYRFKRKKRQQRRQKRKLYRRKGRADFWQDVRDKRKARNVVMKKSSPSIQVRQSVQNQIERIKQKRQGRRMEKGFAQA